MGSGYFSYKWLKDGKIIAYSPSLTINSFLPEHQGSYVCVVNDSHVSVESNPAQLTLSKSVLFLHNISDYNTSYIQILRSWNIQGVAVLIMVIVLHYQ